MTIKSFEQFMNEQQINEKVVNVSSDDDSLRRKYADQVWSIIEEYQEDFGGVDGTELKSKKEMMTKGRLWKMAVDDKKDLVRAVVVYKDEAGKDIIAKGEDGSNIGVKKLKELTK